MLILYSLLLIIIYLAFISLGLPDALLGSAWPSMYQGLHVPLSYAGIISMLIAMGTVISSLQSARLTKKFGTGKITFVSVLITAISLFGFSFSHSFYVLCILAIPYGLGAGSVDASINNYVAIHYPSRHMSWLHAFWGIGATLGPLIMGFTLGHGGRWQSGYQFIAIFQILLTIVLFATLPFWQKTASQNTTTKPVKIETNLLQMLKLPGAFASIITFFCYSAIEQTTGLWASSYLVLTEHVSTKIAATLAGLFYFGIAVGRILSGFLTLKFSDRQMTHIGLATILLGVLAILLPGNSAIAITGFILVGLGCAPVFPSLIHATPDNFGLSNSQALIGIQMASAYIGTCFMPPLFGLIANSISIGLLPLYLLVLLGIMTVSHETLAKRRQNLASK